MITVSKGHEGYKGHKGETLLFDERAVRPADEFGHALPFVARIGGIVRRVTTIAGIALVLAWSGATAQDRSGTVTELLQNAAVKSALASAKANEPQTVDDQIRFCEIPAPSFK